MSIRHSVSQLITLGLFSLSFGALVCHGQPTEPTGPPKHLAPHERPLEYWIDQLSHDRFYRREVATRQLAKAGLAAVPILQQSVATGDLEATERAIQVLGKIALTQSPSDEQGAWGALTDLVKSGTGSRRARAQAAIDQIWQVREGQARESLRIGGVFVGLSNFAIGPLTSEVQLVRIDEEWHGEIETLGWLRWLPDIRNVTIARTAIRADVVEAVVKMPDVHTIALVDGKLDLATVAPLKNLRQLNSLDIRYIRLQNELLDAIAELPLRESLNLMGTEVEDERVDLMRTQLPGLAITNRRGGFLGVTCRAMGVAQCRISSVLPGSAAARAGLQADDVIVRIDDTIVQQFSDLQEKVKQHLTGDEITIRYLRQNEQRQVKLKLGMYLDK